MPADLTDLRVHASNPDVQGVVVTDQGGRNVRVVWDDGDRTWSRRDLLYLVGGGWDRPEPAFDEEGGR